MSERWTKEQKQVIESRGRSLLVSAAAGSGKTAVLTERIIGRILDREEPVDIDRLLVLTFTNAAAAEMRERIDRALWDALERDPDNEHLRRQTALLHHAQITTYDSFCLYLVRNYFHRVGLSPSFRVADPGEISLLQADVLDTVFTESYEKAEKGDDFTLLIEGYGGSRSDEGVREMVRVLSSYAESYPWPSEWLRSCGEIYQTAAPEELLSAPVMGEIFRLIRGRLTGYAKELRYLADLSFSPDGPEVYHDILLEEAEELLDFAGIPSFPELRDAFLSRKERRLPPAKGYQGNEDKKAFIQNERKKIKDDLKKMQSDYLAHEPVRMWKDLNLAAGSALALLKLTERYREEFRKVKMEKNLVDFSDMEHYALEILVDPETKELTEIAKNYREYFAEIMVDEYQDSNFLQEALLDALSGEAKKNRFIVGDVKQSIYRFRLSRPELFMEKMRVYLPDDKDRCRIDLHKNFRSREGVLEAVNDICSRIMDRDLGLVNYDREAALYPGAVYPENPEECLRLLLLEGDREEVRLAGWKDTVEGEAHLMAREIRRLLKEGSVTDKETGELRPVRLSDIVILLRSPGSDGERVSAVLSEKGIASVLPRSTGYFSAPEVSVILSFLQIIDNPCQDIPLTAVLRSAMFGFTDEELAGLRGEEPFFYQSVLKSERTEGFRRILADYRRRARDTRVHELISQILEETGYLAYVTALPAGPQRRANLLMLVEKAVAYEKTSYHGLYHFVRYIENIRKYEVDFGEADTGAGEAEAVRILSIHKSKGLEFPVVILSRLGKKFNRQEERQKLVLHPTYGMGLFAVDGKRRLKSSTILREGLEELTQEESLGEELRVLYVALTRAKEKLILIGSAEGAKELLGRASYSAAEDENGRLSYYLRFHADSFLSLILPALLSYGEKYLVETASPKELTEEGEKEGAGRALKREHILALASSAKELPELSRMEYVYPYEQEKNIRSKVSVSELKHQAMLFEEGEAEEPSWVKETKHPGARPSFADGERDENRGALRGSAVHRVMECIDFAALSPVLSLGDRELTDWVKEELLRQKREKLITEEMYSLVKSEKIAEFLRSPLAKRMAESAERGELYKEKPFVMGIPAEEVYHIRSDETVLVQGIIDVFFREGEEYVIMDYKTDSVASGKALVDRYQTQLDLYADAVRKNKKAPVREKLIYSFHLGETVVLPV